MAPPTACNRSAGPAVKPVPVRPRHVIDAFDSVSYPRIPLRRPAILSFGGVPLVCLRACGGRRAHSENGGVPEGCPARRDGGLCLFRALPAHRAEGPQPPHELGRGGRVRLRLRHPAGDHLLAAAQEPLGPLPPVHPYLEGHAGALGHQLRLVAGLGIAPGPLDSQLPDERVAGPADSAEAHGVRARPLLRGEAEVGRHLPAGAEPREVADLGREGGGEREPAPLDRLERLDLGREGARRDGGPVFGEEGPPRLVGRLDLVPQRRKRPDASVVGGVYAVEPPEEAVRPVLPGVAGRRRAAVDIAAAG